ncbi:PREDICTED: ankyrin repeat and EF-hand domain-containing protein 1-like isoform X1 [Amphimedon queenslandica]|uniref:Ankyrin repeat and EF-hand domain-containing protein 1 n=2 Tax=Amphimedon queenslandica TaxID=400682 RepID=A0AAN0IXV8_AMPQE|nr:PREDICTED: ankyrin repeat and EF-hand domain-containing protein 1-like isoform X1 [Amphimedon queenslandica]|eukprot:XP_019849609.1 PREDICTED: ankyrin repeat and EF-hand domain-containing protein 1-like isoform X1 [Amphimedon queenslandica]
MVKPRLEPKYKIPVIQGSLISVGVNLGCFLFRVWLIMEMSTGRGKVEELNTSFPVSGRKGGTALLAWSEEGPAMPLASNELEILQVRKLIYCTREQDKAQILKLLEGGIPNLVNYQDPNNGTTALHVAVTLNLDGIVALLLENGAINSIQDKEGCTPFMRACQYGHLQSLEQLAMKGLPMQVADGTGLRTLFHCLHPTGRHVKCLSFLLELGAEPNAKTVAGLPLVCAAAKEGLVPQLEKLLEKGADPNARDVAMRTILGKPAVVFATEAGHSDCLRLLAVSGADLDAVFGDYNLSALHRAASLGMFECIQVLSAYGANFNILSSYNDTAIHFATVAYKLLCIRLLGQRGCPANEVNEVGQTPQKIAKAEGMKDALKELKKLTGYQDKVGKGGKPKGFAESWCIKLYDWLQVNKLVVWESLQNCVDNKNGVLPVETFKTLIVEGMEAPIGEEDWPKLLKIYDKKNEGVLNWEDLLLNHKYIHAQFKLGPNDDIKGKKGKKGKKKGGKKGGKKGKGKILFPIYFEAERPPVAGVADGLIEREEYLTDYQRFSVPLPNGLIDDSPWYLMPQEPSYINLYEAIRHGDFDSIELALSETGMSPDARDKYNKTPLMIAAAHGRCDVAEYLITKGADVNAIDNFMWTPLHHACHAGEEAVVRLLLTSGANTDKQSFNGGTPIMRAIESSQRSIVKLLLEKGAKLNLENSHGDTALDIARSWGDDIIYAMVYAVAAKQPPPEGDGKKDKKKDDKKKKGGGKKGKGKKEDKGPAVIPGPPIVPLPLPSRLPTAQQCVEESKKQISLASLQADTIVKPVTSPRLRQAWGTDQLSPRRFHAQMDKDREQRGIDVIDFDEIRTPFQIQVAARAKALEMADF